MYYKDLMIILLGNTHVGKGKAIKKKNYVKDSEMLNQFTLFSETLDRLEIESKCKLESKLEVVGR